MAKPPLPPSSSNVPEPEPEPEPIAISMPGQPSTSSEPSSEDDDSSMVIIVIAVVSVVVLGGGFIAYTMFFKDRVTLPPGSGAKAGASGMYVENPMADEIDQ